MTGVSGFAFAPGPEQAARLDQQDPLRHFRDRFYIQPSRIYLDGNSLGLASRDAEAALLAALASWKEHGIDGWTQGAQPWFTMAEELGAMQAPLVGARPDEVIVSGAPDQDPGRSAQLPLRPLCPAEPVAAAGL